WSGGQITAIKGRSIPLVLLRELLNLPANFISLQKELSSNDTALLQTLPGPGLRHFGAPFSDVQQTDFADTAAIISQLDWVISVDTSVAHLAAALGKETWIPLPKVSDWRWLEARNDSPWYSQVRLFRQSTAGDWNPILGEIGAAIRARL
ncbi:MAG: glycosyltransferase, partial [Oxalobacteraceae bacterium]|nr:glycosyltransferase [Oxalobacteraceae bacterium]